MKMSKFESELQQAVDNFVNYPGKHASTAYPMALPIMALTNAINTTTKKVLLILTLRFVSIRIIHLQSTTKVLL